jgi:oligopeptidase B
VCPSPPPAGRGGEARCLRPAAQSKLRVPRDAYTAAAAATARAIATMRRWAAAPRAAARLRAAAAPPPAVAAHSAAAGAPPLPPARPERFAAHGRAWSDEYAWMQRGGAGVEAALAGEAARLARWCAARGVAALAARLEAETLAALPGASATPPERVGAFEYWAERRDDAPHARYLRRPAGASTAKSSPTEVVLDLNELAAQHGEGIELGELRLSADGASAAFTLAAPGADEARAAFVRDLASGRVERQAQLGAVVSLEWAADGSTLLYTSPDEGGRPARALRAAAGNLPGAAPSWRPAGGAGSLIWEESDPAFFLALQRSKDWRALLLNAHSKSSSEVRLVPADDPGAAPLTVAPRREGLEYFVERAHSSLYIMSNAAPAEERASAPKAAGGPSRARNRGAAAAADDAQRALEGGGGGGDTIDNSDYGGDGEASRDYSLFSVPAAAAGGGEAVWRDVFPARPGFALHDLDAFSSALVLHGRDARGAPALAALPLRAPPGGGGALVPDASQAVAAPLPPWALHLEPGANANFGAAALRVNLSSPVRPDAAFDWAFGGGGGALAAAGRAPGLGGGLTAADFSCERLMVPIAGAEDALGGDGSSSHRAPPAFPLTLVRRRDAAATGVAGPCLVVVYGAYGVPLDADFLPERLPLLARGWSLALVHARGGGELGRRWRAAGRAPGAATAAAADVLAAVDFLAAAGVAAPGRFALEAASAGGVAAGGALAARPRAFGAAALEAPFLDVLSSMLDPGAPLTQHEYGEWGDPRRPEGLDRLLRCCPYANLEGGNDGSGRAGGVDAAAFPPLLLTAARRDARVPFWGPLKYAARLRAAAARGGGARRGEVLLALDAHGGGHWPGEAARPAFRALQGAFLIAAMGPR